MVPHYRRPTSVPVSYKLYLNLNQLRENDCRHGSLWLDRSNIGNHQALVLAKALQQNTSVTNLRLDVNQIGADGVKVLVGVLPRTNVRKLHLGNNQIGDHGVKFVAQALMKTTLETLSLSSNGVGDDGIETLAAAIQESTGLKNLSLWNNNVTDKGAELLLNALKYNDSLCYLNLDKNNVSAFWHAKIEFIVQANKAGIRSQVVQNNKKERRQRVAANEKEELQRGEEETRKDWLARDIKSRVHLKIKVRQMSAIFDTQKRSYDAKSLRQAAKTKEELDLLKRLSCKFPSTVEIIGRVAQIKQKMNQKERVHEGLEHTRELEELYDMLHVEVRAEEENQLRDHSDASLNELLSHIESRAYLESKREILVLALDAAMGSYDVDILEEAAEARDSLDAIDSLCMSGNFPSRGDLAAAIVILKQKIKTAACLHTKVDFAKELRDVQWIHDGEMRAAKYFYALTRANVEGANALEFKSSDGSSKLPFTMNLSEENTGQCTDNAACMDDKSSSAIRSPDGEETQRLTGTSYDDPGASLCRTFKNIPCGVCTTKTEATLEHEILDIFAEPSAIAQDERILFNDCVEAEKNDTEIQRYLTERSVVLSRCTSKQPLPPSNSPLKQVQTEIEGVDEILKDWSILGGYSVFARTIPSTGTKEGTTIKYRSKRGEREDTNERSLAEKVTSVSGCEDMLQTGHRGKSADVCRHSKEHDGLIEDIDGNMSASTNTEDGQVRTSGSDESFEIVNI